ncbi:MAG: ABC transporter permease [Acidobacteria bacterium]|nr:ABC transporter permease [Acidobacteriota bacterium]
MKLEFFIAGRYLRARRKQAVISVVTAISILGVAAGVAALIIALALNTGFQVELQSKILGATSHITLLQTDGRPIAEFAALIGRLYGLKGVRRLSPAIYGQVFLVGGVQNQGVQLKGVDPADAGLVSELLRNVSRGDIRSLASGSDVQGILIGKELSRKTGAGLNSFVRVVAPEGELSPFGRAPRSQLFKVAGIFESGLWDFDANWAFVSLSTAQQLLRLKSDQVTGIEVRIEDIYQAGPIARQLELKAGEGYQALTWIELNRPLFSALRLEKLAMFVAIGLIVLVASLTIVTTLTLMVMEKQKDIAIFTAMGGQNRSVMSVFMLQGIIIGVVGTVLGTLCGVSSSWLLNRYRIIHLEPDVYSIAYVPFRVRWEDVAVIGLVAVLISFLATLYPARSAAQLDPVEALRYE